jgi:hypothetical protein
VSRPKVLSGELCRSGSLMRNYSVARPRANLTDIDKDFLNLPDFCSGATGKSGRFNEGLLLRRLQ